MEDDVTQRGDRYCETDYKQTRTNIGSVMDRYYIEVNLMTYF